MGAADPVAPKSTPAHNPNWVTFILILISVCLQGSSQVVTSAQVPANMSHRRLLEPKTKEEQGPQSTTSVGVTMWGAPSLSWTKSPGRFAWFLQAGCATMA